MTDPTSAAGETEGALLVDPDWTASEERPEPPLEAMAGVWAVRPGQALSRFLPNPCYRPLNPETPLDPVEVVLRDLARGEPADAALRSALRNAWLGVAVDDRQVALVSRAPDGEPVVLVATAHGHRARLGVPAWLDVTVEQLAAALPADGVDVLLNPGSPASMRVRADVVREIAG